MSINIKLENLYNQDIKDRKKFQQGRLSVRQLSINDQKRLANAKKILPSLDQSEIWNCHYAALILHHSNNRTDHKKAHLLAKQALAMGSKATKWLYAATLDRMLVSQGKPQKFGTQFTLVGGKKFHFASDRSVPDKTKKAFHVIK